MIYNLWENFSEILSAVTDIIYTPSCMVVWAFWLALQIFILLLSKRKRQEGGEK